MTKLNLKKVQKGIYRNESPPVRIELSNPKLANGFGENSWELTIEIRDEWVFHEFFQTKKRALIRGGEWIETELADYL